MATNAMVERLMCGELFEDVEVRGLGSETSTEADSEEEERSFLESFGRAFEHSSWKELCPGLPPSVLLRQLGVEVPGEPGDIAICGDMHESVVGFVAGACRSWVYFNSPTDPAFHREALEKAGVLVEVQPFVGLPSDVATSSLLRALDTLPRPIMLQCGSGMRCGAALALWLSLRRGLSKGAAKQLAARLDLSFWREQAAEPLREWVLKRLPEESAAVH